MGCSGAAFRVGFDPERWDPSAASPHGRALLERAGRAAGVRIDRVDPPFDDELRELVWERIVETVDARLPPIVRGLAGGPEFAVLAGYDTQGKVLFVRAYGQDERKEPERKSFDEAFGNDPPPVPVFLDRGTARAELELARDAVRHAAQLAQEREERDDGERWLVGASALEAWARALAADVPQREGAARAFGDWWARAALHDARRAAGRFLRSVRARFSDRVGAELLRAAEAYGYVAEEAAKAGVGAFDGSVVARFLDLGLRRGWAHALERAITHEREAAAALASAASML